MPHALVPLTCTQYSNDFGLLHDKLLVYIRFYVSVSLCSLLPSLFSCQLNFRTCEPLEIHHNTLQQIHVQRQKHQYHDNTFYIPSKQDSTTTRRPLQGTLADSLALSIALAIQRIPDRRGRDTVHRPAPSAVPTNAGNNPAGKILVYYGL